MESINNAAAAFDPRFLGVTTVAGRCLLYTSFVAVAAAAGALGLAAAVVLGENRGLTLAGRSFDSVDLAGMLAGLAVIIGFALGYYGRQWLHERRQPGSPPQER